MIASLQGLQWWHWWIAAAALAAIEAIVPGAVAIWFAAGAAVIGALLLVVPMPWQLQMVLFCVLSISALALWRRYQRQHPQDSASEQPMLNQRGAQYVGRVVDVSEAIHNGTGKVQLGDGHWKVRGPDLPRGARVRIVSAEGALLVVEKEAS
ncbi:MAG TPA: NfeD family protein [Steroidobacteraceae bacterium]|nr:NfeD family protein [Steroidobacteraceae bacterium]